MALGLATTNPAMAEENTPPICVCYDDCATEADGNTTYYQVTIRLVWKVARKIIQMWRVASIMGRSLRMIQVPTHTKNVRRDLTAS